MAHNCEKEEDWGKVKEFMGGMKGMRTAISGIVVAILLQVGSFLFMWGGLTTTVNQHTKDIDRVCMKLDKVKLIGYAYAEEGKPDSLSR